MKGLRGKTNCEKFGGSRAAHIYLPCKETSYVQTCYVLKTLNPKPLALARTLKGQSSICRRSGLPVEFPDDVLLLRQEGVSNSEPDVLHLGKKSV